MPIAGHCPASQHWELVNALRRHRDPDAALAHRDGHFDIIGRVGPSLSDHRGVLFDREYHVTEKRIAPALLEFLFNIECEKSTCL